MFETIMNFFCRRTKPSETSVEKKPDAKGYMYVFEALYLEKLDVEAYLKGDWDAEMKRQAKFSGAAITKRKIFNSIEELIEDQKKTGFTHREGSAYILCLKTDKEKTYELIMEGKFHEAISHTINFHEFYRDHLASTSKQEGHASS